MELPNDLRNILDTELSHISAASLKDTASVLSGKYRNKQPSAGGSLIQSKSDVDAYAAFRMPATFAAVYSAMKQVKNRLPEWSPNTLLDTGAGPGTVMWAASAAWPALNDITLIEREDSMIELGKRLARHSDSKTIQNSKWYKKDIIELCNSNIFQNSPYDIVTASYVLGEIRDEHKAQYIESLWQLTGGVLLIIEPGTPDRFSFIKQARDLLLSAGATIIAPCPCFGICPMENDNWCHFSQRVSRSRLHKQVKSADLSYEDEKFSFIAVSRMPVKPMSGRVIRHPQVRKGHIIIESCSKDAVCTNIITRKDKEMYRQARDLEWGSELPFGYE